MFDFFFKYFLVFPKIVLSGHWGILIGEIVLVFYFFLYLSTRKKISVSPPLASYYLFVAYYLAGSSLIAAVYFNFLPLHSILYFVRILLCSGLFLWSVEYYKKMNSDRQIIEQIYNKPFFVHFVISAIIMITYYATHSPTKSDILWVYELGLRMIPIAGLVIDFDSFFFLKAISGSGNLLAGWALAIFIINFNSNNGGFGKRIFIVALLTILFTLSRGGFLTASIYIIYSFIRNFNFKISLRTGVAVSLSVALLFIYFSYASETPLPNMFGRLNTTYETGNLDGSSQGRLDNYVALLKSWTTHWHYVIFGFGYDEEAVLLASKQTVIESYFLQVLFCSGLIGMVLLVGFFLLSYLNRQRNFWYRCLWEFLFFQSIVSWTITGGDFLAPHATYIFMTFLGFGFAKSLAQKTQALSNGEN